MANKALRTLSINGVEVKTSLLSADIHYIYRWIDQRGNTIYVGRTKTDLNTRANKALESINAGRTSTAVKQAQWLADKGVTSIKIEYLMSVNGEKLAIEEEKQAIKFYSKSKETKTGLMNKQFNKGL